jgi:hypothetical protein
MRPSRAATLGLLLYAVLVAGCITRPVRQPVYKEAGVEVFLRGEKRLSSYVEKDFDHPVTISAVRMTHILSRLDIRKSVDEGNRRVPAIPTDILYSVADGLSKALGQASVNQEAVVMAVRKERTLRILDQDYLTSFVAYVRGDQLYIHLARSDWFVPDKRRQSRGLPEPRVGEHPTRLKLYGGTAMTLLDTQSIAVSWRDPIFSRATRTKILPTGEVKRKTILLESPGGEFSEEEVLEGQARYPSGLTPGQLRALADLEEARAAGLITEADYRLRVQEILDQ